MDITHDTDSANEARVEPDGSIGDLLQGKGLEFFEQIIQCSEHNQHNFEGAQSMSNSFA